MPRFQYRSPAGGGAPANEYVDLTQIGTDNDSFEKVDGHVMHRDFLGASRLMRGSGTAADAVTFVVGAGKIVAQDSQANGLDAYSYAGLFRDIHESGNDQRGYLVVDTSFAGGDLLVGINPDPTPSIILVRNFANSVQLPDITASNDGRCWTIINQRTNNDSGVSNGLTNVIAGSGVQVGDIDADTAYRLKGGEAATFMAVYGGGGANWDTTGSPSRWVVINKFVHAETP